MKLFPIKLHYPSSPFPKGRPRGFFCFQNFNFQLFLKTLLNPPFKKGGDLLGKPLYQFPLLSQRRG